MNIKRIIIVLLVLLPASVYSQSLDAAKSLVEEGDYLAAASQIRLALIEQPKNAEVLYYATRIFSEIELHEEAVMYGSRMYAEENDIPEYVQAFAFALTRAGQPLEAITVLRRLQKKSDDVRTSLLLVNALSDADSLNQAELVATTAKKKFPNSADAYFALGILYFKYKPQPVLELAVQNLEEAIKLNDKLVLAHFVLAQSYWKMANKESDADLANALFKRSLLEWNKVTQLDSLNARAWFEQGKIFFLAEKWNDAVVALLKYRELRPVGTGDAIASWYLGSAYYRLNRCDSAQIHLDDASRLIDSLRTPASLQLAKCKFLSKDWVGASHTYGTALAGGKSMKDWENINVWYYGASLVLSGDTTRGIEVMDEAAVRDPKQCGLMFRYGLLLQQKNKNARSTEIFRQRLANCQDSLDTRIHFLIGNNFFADSLVDSAIAEYETALKGDPGNGIFLVRLAETFASMGNVTKARELYHQVVIAGSDSSAEEHEKRTAISAILKLNALDMELKDWAAIVNRSKSSLTLDPKNKWLLLYIAFGYQGMGKTDDACKYYKEVLKIDPQNDSAQKNSKALSCP
ncbi:MAG: tetratricopeptide repeat protein [Ignavibacteria bacterium]|nr:tetratricopeptide repeat protein [Ignavibacteria bacterium]